MDKEKIICAAEAFVHSICDGEASGHDWFHVDRVRRTALRLAEAEGADPFIVELAALLHDVDDWKFSTGGTAKTEAFLLAHNVDEAAARQVLTIVRTLSYRGGVVDSTQKTPEGMVVQDADRLDAMGAIGVARAFAYGGCKGRPMYDPAQKPVAFSTLDEVRDTPNHTVNHFYEKLLKLKDLMNTDAARAMAGERHRFMLEFLEEFYGEWDGER